MHEPEFDEIFGCDWKTVKSAITKDQEGWLESDYQEALSVLRKLHSKNPQQYSDFLNRLRGIVGLDKFSLQRRCQLIYFLLSSYIDWGKTKLGAIRLTESEKKHYWFSEKINSDSPKIKFDFQNLVDQLLEFSPSSEQLDELASIFFHQPNTHQTEEEHSPEIVHGMGKKSKPGRKRQTE